MRTAFGTAIKVALIKSGHTNGWLCKKVEEKTGMYFDDSYLSKICRGVVSKPIFEDAIRDILGLKGGNNNAKA